MTFKTGSKQPVDRRNYTMQKSNFANALTNPDPYNGGVVS